MQKVLRKRVLRDLKENLFRYIALAFLIIMGMYVIVSLIGAGYTIIDNGETHDEANKIEDGQFSVFVPLSDEEISRLEDAGAEVEKCSTRITMSWMARLSGYLPTGRT